MPHTTCGIQHVAFIARDNMDMQVRHGLAGGASEVDTDVVSVWAVIPLYCDPGLRDGLGKCLLFLGRRIKPRFDMPNGEQQRVPWRRGELVPYADCMPGLEEHLSGFWRAKRAMIGWAYRHGIYISVMSRSPERPASWHSVQRHAGIRRLPYRSEWHTGQRCSYLAPAGGRRSRRGRPGRLTSGASPATSISSCHSGPCGAMAEPYRRCAATWANSWPRTPRT